MQVLEQCGHTQRRVIVAVEAPGIQVPTVGHILFAVACSVVATATTFGIPVLWITPSQWKRGVGLPVGQRQTRPQKKGASLSLARTLWPSCPSHDAADAYLLGRYVIESKVLD